VREPTALTVDVVCAPHASALAAVGRVAGRRWTVESGLEGAQGEVGLEQSAGRSWPGGYRHRTVARWAYALLTVLRAAHLPSEAAPKKSNLASARAV